MVLVVYNCPDRRKSVCHSSVRYGCCRICIFQLSCSNISLTVVGVSISGSTGSDLCISISPIDFSNPLVNLFCDKGNFPNAKICLLNYKVDLFYFCMTHIKLFLIMDIVFIYLFQFILKIDLQLSLIINSFLLLITKIL